MPEAKNITISEIGGNLNEDSPTVKFKFVDDGATIPQALSFVSKLENNSGRHTEQPFKNRYKLKSQNNGNEFRSTNAKPNY